MPATEQANPRDWRNGRTLGRFQWYRNLSKGRAAESKHSNSLTVPS